ncbi:hypothetical protein P8452_50635 [Trifolium repens]|nr:hypothetical protein P8452_50635 [Trifolium repens]
MSTLYLSIKYPLDNGKVGTIKGDQALARRCYESSLKIKHRAVNASSSARPVSKTGGVNMINPLDLDPREELQDRRVSLIEELEKVQIGSEAHQTTNIGTSMKPEEREKILATLKKNIDLFAWHPSDMPGIDETIITQIIHLARDQARLTKEKEGRRRKERSHQ